MTKNNRTEPNDERAEQVWDALIADQNFVRGVVGGIACAAIGVGLAHVIATLDFRPRLTMASAFIGVLVAFGMRQWGWGVQRRFRVAALLITAVALASHVVLLGMARRIATSSMTVETLREHLNWPFAWALSREILDAEGLVYLVFGLWVAWRFACRRLRPKDLR